jgi:hypothetical protein
MGRHNPCGDAEAEASASLFGREKWLENALPDLFRDAGPAVLDTHDNRMSGYFISRRGRT